MRVLVTGANGHIGANLVRALLSRGDKVRALIHRGAAAVDGLEIEMVRGDVRDPGSIAAAMDGVDSVFHLAAFISIDGPHNGLVHQINVDGSRNVAEAALAAGVRRLVHFSSIHAFKQTPGDQPLDEERAKVSGRGHPAYDLSKAAGEAEVRTVIAKGLDAVIVNLSGVIGPFDFGPSRMGRVFLQLYERRIAGLVSDGFNWVDVRDVVAGALAAAERGRTGENYLLSGRWLTIRELASIAAEITGIAPPSLSSPMWLARSRPWRYSTVPRCDARHCSRRSRRRRWPPIATSAATRPAGNWTMFPARPARRVQAIYLWFVEAGRLKPNDALRALATER